MAGQPNHAVIELFSQFQYPTPPLATAQADPEHAERWRQSATRAGQRLVADMGSLR